ncbi:MAG: hypothetical protein Q7V43_16830 [Myxococcales bacterium]|nr:hypothetical protein [Myxococcales bacterium]
MRRITVGPLLVCLAACSPNEINLPAVTDAATTDRGAPTDASTALDVSSSDAPIAPLDAPLTIDVPAVQTDAPAVQTDAPVVQTDIPVVQTDVPVVQTDVPVAMPDAGVVDRPPASLVDALVGTWATRVRGTTVQTAPIIGMVRTSSSAFGLAVITRAPAGELSITERACRVTFDRSTLGQTSLEDRAVQSVAPATAALRFVRVGAAWRWQRAARTLAVGWRPTTSAEEMLPAAASDPRVYDADGDGNPGVSVRIQSLIVNGFVYVVQAQRGALDGDWDAAGAPRAVNNPAGSTQRTVGASVRTLETDLPSAVDTSAAANAVTLARLPPGADCASLIAALPTLFR